MIAKILNFLCVYILSILNFFVILMPITFLILMALCININQLNKSLMSITFLFISVVSGLMLFLLFINFLFNSSVKYFIKRSTQVKEDHEFFIIFEEIKTAFNKQNVVLLIQNNQEINAYAVGGFRKNAIILTTGLINNYKSKIDNKNDVLIAVKSIIGHEMSHIVNRDFLPGLLLLTNKQANNFISKFLFIFFKIFTRLLSIIPYIGVTLSNLIISVYNLLDSFINFFYKNILLKVYHFIELQISKSIEYRADKQSALICGGKNMGFALSFLGKSGFFTLFSTHPSTATRIRKVRNVESNKKIIKPVAFSEFIVFLSFILLLFITIHFFKRANLEQLIQDYNRLFIIINEKIYSIKNTITYYYMKIKTDLL